MTLEHRSRSCLTRSNLSNGCGLYLQPTQRTPVGYTCSSQASNPSRMNTYAKCAANPRGMNTYKAIGLKGLKASWNEHLQKIGGGEVLLLPSSCPRREGRGARVTYAIAVTYGRFASPFVPEGKSTPSLSIACALFCECYRGGQEIEKSKVLLCFASQHCNSAVHSTAVIARASARRVVAAEPIKEPQWS